MFYSWSTIITSCLLILGFSVSLWLISRDVKVPFVINILILLILSNVGAVLEIVANLGVDRGDNLFIIL